jgi:hypothetical protein
VSPLSMAVAPIFCAQDPPTLLLPQDLINHELMRQLVSTFAPHSFVELDQSMQHARNLPLPLQMTLLGQTSTRRTSSWLTLRQVSYKCLFSCKRLIIPSCGTRLVRTSSSPCYDFHSSSDSNNACPGTAGSCGLLYTRLTSLRLETTNLMMGFLIILL